MTITQISEGIKISVETLFRDDQSQVSYNHYMFSYRIRIENMTQFTVQLLSRYWRVFDANGTHKEVEGQGVVGKQPVIEPGMSYEYVSGVNLTTGFGSMHGKYFMRNMIDDTMLAVDIPKFRLEVPFRLN